MDIKHIKAVALIVAGINFFMLSEVKCQLPIAGQGGAIYVDIVPDTLLNPIPYYGGTEDYYIDMNQDGMNDVKIEASGFYSPGTDADEVQVYALNKNTMLSLGGIDSFLIPSSSCGPAFSVAIPVLRKYNAGDTIRASDYVSSGSVGYHSRGGSCYDVINSQWVDSTDHYIGVRYADTFGTFYGWIRVLVISEWSVLIKDFSLSLPPMKGDHLHVFPNPSSTMMQVALEDNIKLIEIKVFDILGTEKIKTAEKEIDVSRLSEGVYFVRAQTNKGVFQKKIIVLHQ